MGWKTQSHERSRLTWAGPTCNYKPDAEIVYLRRERKDGTAYGLKLRMGDPCGATAAVTRKGERGECQHRCMAHVGEREN